MKKRSIVMLLILFLSIFMLTGCTDLSNLFVSVAKVTTTTNSSNETTKTINGGTTTVVITTTTADGGDTHTTKVVEVTTTLPNSDNYYKIENVSYTAHDLGLNNEFYDWRYLPSIGEQKILVIPVKIAEYASEATEKVRTEINEVMFGDPKNNKLYWESLSSFYYKSSYGKLSISGEVTNYMYNDYTLASFESHDDDEEDNPLQDLYDDFDSFVLSEGIDTKEYDSDNDGFVDLVMFIYVCEHSTEDNNLNDNYWAYCTSADFDSNKEKPTLNNYIWASYDFMYESPTYSFDKKLDAHTYIHESGHAMGLDDYYNSCNDNNEDNDAVGSNIMMSNNICDHDAYSKFALGWINPYVVTGNASITINPICESGDAIILPIGDFENNAYAQYLIFEYYTPDGLNEKDTLKRYRSVRGISGSGIRVFYIDSRVCISDNDENTTIINVISDYDKDKYTGLYPAFSNNPELSILNEFKGTGIKPEEDDHLNLIQLIDASTNSLYYECDEATSSQLFTSRKVLDTSLINFHLSATLNYTVTFTRNLDNTYTLNFTNNR